MFSINSRIKSFLNLVEKNGVEINKLTFIAASKVHLILYDIQKLINQFFSINSMVMFSDYTIHCAIMFFAFYDICLRSFKLENILYFVGGIGYQFSLILNIFSLVHISRKVMENSLNIYEIIERKLIAGQNLKLGKRSQVLALQTDSKIISTCGVFNFDWKMILNVFACGFSYFIVAIQFEMIFKAKE